MRSSVIAFLLTTSTLMIGVVDHCSANDDQKAQTMLRELESRVKPLAIASGRASFDAYTTGDSAAYAQSNQMSLALESVFSDTTMFKKIRALRDSANVVDPLLKRQIGIAYLSFLGNQVDPKLIASILERETALDQKFNTYRVDVGGRQLSDNQVDSILRYSSSSSELESVWKASRRIGQEVRSQVIELAKLRNEVAHTLGFADFFEMHLRLAEQEPAEVIAVFDELDILTREPFRKLKSEIDSALAKKHGFAPDQLRPWHYQNRFFQEAPRIYEVNLDSYFQGKDPVNLSRLYFAGIGLPVDSILARSDLYERPGKYQHAQCMDIDREGDVRIICNVRPDYYWMNTMLHELGHAVYDYYYDDSLPWFLRGAAHSLTTEAVANFFGRLASNPRWLVQSAGVSKEAADSIAGDCRRTLRLEQLVFSRWAQVVVRFERAMYANPDQDLNALWYALVEKYQALPPLSGRTEPDWAAKIHIALYPAYYHNYVLGELLASQFAATIGKDVFGTGNPLEVGFSGDTAIGAWLKERVFVPGSRYRWEEMVERATGEKLTAKYFARQFVEPK